MYHKGPLKLQVKCLCPFTPYLVVVPKGHTNQVKSSQNVTVKITTVTLFKNSLFIIVVFPRTFSTFPHSYIMGRTKIFRTNLNFTGKFHEIPNFV